MKRILFIDDDALALQLMAKVTNMLGYQAILSTSARKGLSLAVRERPDLIIVDMQMDEMNGQDFVRTVRQSPEIADMPVVILSAGVGYFDADKARQAGANAYLQKPVGVNELLKTIQVFAMPA